MTSHAGITQVIARMAKHIVFSNNLQWIEGGTFDSCEIEFAEAKNEDKILRSANAISDIEVSAPRPLSNRRRWPR